MTGTADLRRPRDASSNSGEPDRVGTLPVLPRIRLAAYSTTGQPTKADDAWLSALALSDGTAALTIGATVGQDPPEPAVTTRLLAVLEELLATETTLDVVLARLDALAARTPALQATPLALTLLSPDSGTLRYAACGHPAPLVVGPGGSCRILDSTPTGPLGTGHPPRATTTVLQPGDVLVLFSQGLVQRPDRTMTDGIADVRAAAARIITGRRWSADLPSDDDQWCQVIADELASPGRHRTAAIMTAQYCAEPIAGLSLRMLAGPTTAVEIRRAFASWTDQLGLPKAECADLHLAVAEIVANAVEHANPPGRAGFVDVVARVRDDGYLDCEVRDQGAWREPDPLATDRGHGLMVASQVVDFLQVSRGIGPDGACGAAEGTVVTMRHRLGKLPTVVTASSGSSAEQPAEPLVVERGIDGGSPLATVSGDVDRAGALRMTRELVAISRGCTTPLTVDLAGVSNLTSYGVRALYQVTWRLAVNDQSLQLIAPDGTLAHDVLHLAQLPHVS